MGMIPFLVMIVLHSATGIEIDVNTNSITNLRRPEPNNPNFTDNVKCQINMYDGKFVTVKETCHEVRQKMEGHHK